MLRLLLDDDEPHSDGYDWTIRTLQQIDGDGNMAATLAYFDLQVLRMLGHAPGTDRCTDCGGEVHVSARIPFSLEAGGIVCRACRPRQRSIISIRRELLQLIRDLQSAENRNPGVIPQNLHGELRGTLNRYIQTVVGSLPRMQTYLPMMTRTEPTA